MLVIKLTYDGNKFDIPGGPRSATCVRHSAQEHEAVFFSLERPEIYRKSDEKQEKHTQYFGIFRPESMIMII